MSTTIDDLASAIARFEGFSVPGSVAQRNNNPGNLRAGPGQIGTDSGGYAIFPDVATGYSALDNQIQLNVNRGLNLNQFFGGLPGVYAGYAPAADKNNPGQYASTVASWLGIDTSTPLADVLNQGSPTVSDIGAPADTSSSSLASDISSWTGNLSSDVFGSLDQFSVAGLSGVAVVAIALVIGAVVLLVARR